MAAPAQAQVRPGMAGNIARLVARPPFRLLWRVRISGVDTIPAGGAIIAANHQSVIDSFFLGLYLPRPIVFIGKAEYLDSWKTRYLFPALGMIPIDRSGGTSSVPALDAGARLLEEGRLLGVYPEGTRSRSGRLHKGRTGIARLAFRTGVPVVPVGIVGTRSIQPPDVAFPRPFMHAELRIGRPVGPESYSDRIPLSLGLRAMTDDVMFAIRELSGLTYDPTYAEREWPASDGGARGEAKISAGVMGDDRPLASDALGAETTVTGRAAAVA
jgi:1-acyl-sn-glycerol-3-phosphate acyltransferase